MKKHTAVVIAAAAIAVTVVALPVTREAIVGALTRPTGATATAEAAAGETDATPPTPERAVPTDGTDAPRKMTALPVGAVVVERAPFVQTIRATGRADAPRQVVLSSRVSERVTRVHVTEGDHVEPGDVLVTLDRRPFEIARREAEARRATAEADQRVTLLDDDAADATRRALAAHRSGLTEAQEALARAELDLEGTRVTAPFAGEIVAVDAVEGALAQAGQSLVTLVDLDDVRIPAEVLENDFGALVPGAAARVRVAAFPDAAFTGEVIALSPVLDADRGTGLAYVAIENPERRVLPGMYAEAEIEAATHADRIAVPRRAILERDRKLLVFRASGGRAEWQYVETGLESDTMIEVTRGLAPGDTVLVDGHLTLAHGAPIRPKITSP